MKSEIPSAKARGVPFGIVVLAACLIILISLFPTISLYVFMIVFGVASLLLSVLRYWACILPKPKAERQELEECPVLTIMLPLYHEGEIVHQLMTAVEKIDYPKDRLQVQIICEPDDLDTINLVRPYVNRTFELCVTNGAFPRTKPHALNQALKQARGDIITIYDAEDIPHPKQARVAIETFAANPNWGALQAPLTYYNAGENWLTRQFTLEYDAQFQVWLPLLFHLKLPFPLGGTSNFVKRSILMQTKGWDSYNVTEDADLSFRIAALGAQIGYIYPETQESATANFKDWRKQRQRWFKGFLQTWFAHMHSPFSPGGLAGWARQITLQLTIGLSLLAGLFHLPLMVILFWHNRHGEWLLLMLGCLSLTYVAGMAVGFMGIIRQRRFELLGSIVFMPIYWLLLFIPAVGAIIELWRAPFYWNKTPHSVSAQPHV